MPEGEEGQSPLNVIANHLWDGNTLTAPRRPPWRPSCATLSWKIQLLLASAVVGYFFTDELLHESGEIGLVVLFILATFIANTVFVEDGLLELRASVDEKPLLHDLGSLEVSQHRLKEEKNKTRWLIFVALHSALPKPGTLLLLTFPDLFNSQTGAEHNPVNTVLHIGEAMLMLLIYGAIHVLATAMIWDNPFLHKCFNILYFPPRIFYEMYKACARRCRSSDDSAALSLLDSLNSAQKERLANEFKQQLIQPLNMYLHHIQLCGKLPAGFERSLNMQYPINNIWLVVEKTHGGEIESEALQDKKGLAFKIFSLLVGILAAIVVSASRLAYFYAQFVLLFGVHENFIHVPLKNTFSWYLVPEIFSWTFLVIELWYLAVIPAFITVVLTANFGYETAHHVTDYGRHSFLSKSFCRKFLFFPGVITGWDDPSFIHHCYPWRSGIAYTIAAVLSVFSYIAHLVIAREVFTSERIRNAELRNALIATVFANIPLYKRAFDVVIQHWAQSAARQSSDPMIRITARVCYAIVKTLNLVKRMTNEELLSSLRQIPSDKATAMGFGRLWIRAHPEEHADISGDAPHVTTLDMN